MAITLTSPLDAVIANKSSVSMTWTTTLQGQNAYEFQYKRASDSSWSTLGKVSSTNKNGIVNLTNLTDNIKYHYRLILYYDYKDSVGTIYKGYDVSQAYTMVVNTAKLGTLKIKVSANDVEEMPIYDGTNKGAPIYKVKFNASKIAMATFSNDVPELAGRLKTHMSDGNKSSTRATGTFAATGIKPFGYLDNRSSYQYYIPEDWRYNYQKYYYTNNQYTSYYRYTYNYISGYHKTGTDYWYTTYTYNYVSADYYTKHSAEYTYYDTATQTERHYHQTGYVYYTTYSWDYHKTGTRYWYTHTVNYAEGSYSEQHSRDNYAADYSYKHVYDYYKIWLYNYYKYYYMHMYKYYAYQYRYTGYSYAIT